MKHLSDLYQQLAAYESSVAPYLKSAARMAAISIQTAEVGIAGLASTLLAGKTIPFDHRHILNEPLFCGTSIWRLDDGTPFDLSAYPELLEWAELIEDVRLASLRASQK